MHGNRLAIRRTRRLLTITLAAVLWLGLSVCIGCRMPISSFTSLSAPAAVADLPGFRAVWVQADSLTTKAKIDDALSRAEAGRFNAIFANVFVYGQTLYDSDLAKKYERVEAEFNPLAYLVGEAHRRGIQVHAWLVSGPVGYTDGSTILEHHPDWAIVGPDGTSVHWLNFTRPDVRQFIVDMALELVEKYGVDGLHFDYLRYPGPEWGFDQYSIEAFAQQYHSDLNELRYADLPAYGVFTGNPLTDPQSAQVLASFTNGLPAVTFNSYGAGEVIVLNWIAAERQVAVGSEILRRSLERLLHKGGDVYLLRSETNAREYGYGDFDQVQAWLEHLGRTSLVVTETDIRRLAPSSVLVLPNVYLISPSTAAQLADFVRRGGGVIFIDGPTRSIDLEEVQALTGMQSHGRYFEQSMLMVATGNHALIPSSQRGANLASYQLRDVQWREFRKQGIDDLLRDVYQRVKAITPHVYISVTVTSDQSNADRQVLQDWPAWLWGRYVDFVVPRGYVDDVQSLAPVITDWWPAMYIYGRIVWGLKASIGAGNSAIPKPPVQLSVEINMVRAAGSNGFVIFDLEHISQEQLQALHSF